MEHFIIDPLNATSGFTAMSNDTINIKAVIGSISGHGTTRISFDKTNGTDNATYAGITKAVVLSLYGLRQHDKICWNVQASATTNVASSFVRLGYDSANYVEWRFADSSHTAARCNVCTAKVGDGFVTGKGWDIEKITYFAIGVNFDAETDALAAILVNEAYAEKSPLGS